MLAKLFRLSRTQSSIAAAIFNGRSPEDIATARGIKISTVRTHLADIFLRTKVKTQRDLIRLIGSLPPLAR
jgi:DNA-binding CsgD family transcriptional regulator